MAKDWLVWYGREWSDEPIPTENEKVQHWITEARHMDSRRIIIDEPNCFAFLVTNEDGGFPRLIIYMRQ